MWWGAIKNLFKYGLTYYVVFRYGIKLDKTSRIKLPINILIGKKNIIINKNTLIGKNVWMEAISKYYDNFYNPCINIGSNVSIGNYASITCINSINIEDDCLISEHVYISDHVHEHDPSKGNYKYQPLFSKGPVHIEKNVFIGYRVSILGGVRIGKFSVVGSHSVVNRSIPDYCMAVGSPAKVIKKYNVHSKQWEKYN